MAREPRSIRVDAIILLHRDWGEADRLLTLFSLQRGKLRAVAKGARKIKSRKAGHVEPFTHVALQLARGRDLWIVTQAETIEPFIPIREDLSRMGYASLVVELVDRFSFEDESDTNLFRLILVTLDQIARGDDPSPAVGFFIIRLLELMGFRPELFRCAKCGEEIKPRDQFVSPAEGGALCPKCGKSAPASIQISVEALRFLRHFQRSNFATAVSVDIPTPVRQEMERILQNYVTYYLERKLNSPGFLKDVGNIS